MLLPIETKFDVENGLLYAEVDELGTYCIMDIEIWLNNLGVEMPKENQQEENALYFNSPSAIAVSEDSGSVWTPTYTNAPIDLVFVLQSAGTSYSNFAAEKQLITNFASFVIGEYSDVKITVIEFKKDEAKLLTDTLGREYFTNIPMLSVALDNIKYDNSVKDYCDRGKAFEILLNDISLNHDHDIFIYQLVNGNTKSYTNYDNEDVLDILDKAKIENSKYVTGIRSYSEIMPDGWHYVEDSFHEKISKKITTNEDLFITLNNDPLSAMKTHFPTKLSPAMPVFEILLPTCWKKIALKGELNSTNKIDSDEDSLTDWEEVNVDELIKLSDGNYTLPHTSVSKLVAILNQFDVGNCLFVTDNKAPVYYLPILSDPTSEDSDGDGIKDYEDIEPLKIYLDELVQKLEQMEKYIDEYVPEYCDIKGIQQQDVPSNSTIAINILRNYGYGSDEYDLFQDPLNDIKQTIKWSVTDGPHYPEFRDYINLRDPSVIEYLKGYQLFDKTGQKIDFLHLLATLGAERYDVFIDPNLAGWAGDLQSTISNLRDSKNSDTFDSENMDKIIYDLITKKDDSLFPMSDLLADVDAKDIHEIYNESKNLSVVLKNYYTYHTKHRFTRFVDILGGYEELNILAFEYTRGNLRIDKKLILLYFATKSGGKYATEEELNALRSGYFKII